MRPARPKTAKHRMLARSRSGKRVRKGGVTPSRERRLSSRRAAPPPNTDQRQGRVSDRIHAFCRGARSDFATRTTALPALPSLVNPTGRVILSVAAGWPSERYKGMDTLILSMSRLLLRGRSANSPWRYGDDLFVFRDWLERCTRLRVQRHVHS